MELENKPVFKELWDKLNNESKQVLIKEYAEDNRIGDLYWFRCCNDFNATIMPFYKEVRANDTHYSCFGISDICEEGFPYTPEYSQCEKYENGKLPSWMNVDEEKPKEVFPVSEFVFPCFEGDNNPLWFKQENDKYYAGKVEDNLGIMYTKLVIDNNSFGWVVEISEESYKMFLEMSMLTVKKMLLESIDNGRFLLDKEKTPEILQINVPYNEGRINDDIGRILFTATGEHIPISKNVQVVFGKELEVKNTQHPYPALTISYSKFLITIKDYLLANLGREIEGVEEEVYQGLDALDTDYYEKVL